MISLKEQAVNILQNLPEDKMSYVVDMLNWVSGMLDDKNIKLNQLPVAVPGNTAETAAAWARFKKYKGIINYDIDEKTELANARDEKYAGFN
jgi:hypothetical protein